MRIATPISHLFNDKLAGSKISLNSDCLERRDHSPIGPWEKIELFHTDIQPIHPITDIEWNYLARVRLENPNLKLISFHLSSNYKYPSLVDGQFFPNGHCSSRDQLLSTSRKNIQQIKKIFGGQIKLAVENNNYYPTPAYKHVCDPNFIFQLVRENKINFLFDIAHAKVTCVNSNQNYFKYVDELPLCSLIQVHICRHDLRSDGLAIDAHKPPEENDFQEVAKLFNKTKFDYLTIEYYKSTSVLIELLKKFKTIPNAIN